MLAQGTTNSRSLTVAQVISSVESTVLPSFCCSTAGTRRSTYLSCTVAQVVSSATTIVCWATNCSTAGTRGDDIFVLSHVGSSGIERCVDCV